MKDLSKITALLLIVAVTLCFAASSLLAGRPWIDDPPGGGTMPPNKPIDGMLCPGCQQPIFLSDYPWVGKPHGEGSRTPNKPIDGMICPGYHEPILLSLYPWGEDPPCTQANKPPDGD
jgi:hypothetical protein